MITRRRGEGALICRHGLGFAARLAASTVALAACASAGGPREQYRTEVKTQPPPRDSAVAAPSATPAPLPELPMSQIATPDTARRVNLDAPNAPLRDVIRGLAETYGMGYQIDPDVKGMVSVRLTGATLEEALQAVVAGNGYDYSVQAGVLRVTAARLETRIFALDYIALSRFGTGTTIIQRRLGTTGAVGAGGAPGAAGQVTGGAAAGAAGGGAAGVAGAFGGADIISSVEVADLWQEIRVALEGLIFDAPSAAVGAAPTGAFGGFGAAPPGATSRVETDGRRLIINPIAGTILVTASPAKIREVATFLQTFTGSVQRQVIIEAKFVEVALEREFQFGIDWGALFQRGDIRAEVSRGARAGGITLTLSPGGQEITVILDALETQGDVRVLSSPRTSALNNQRAAFSVTTDEVFFIVTQQPIIGAGGVQVGTTTQVQPQQVAVGIILDVFPQIAADNTITMNIRPAVTNLVRVDSINVEGVFASAPVIERRESDTVARVRDGETIVIGGLMQTRHEKRRSGVPVLKDIPLLGKLFSNVSDVERKSELVIFITPTIVAGQPQVIPGSGSGSEW